PGTLADVSEAVLERTEEQKRSARAPEVRGPGAARHFHLRRQRPGAEQRCGPERVSGAKEALTARQAELECMQFATPGGHSYNRIPHDETYLVYSGRSWTRARAACRRCR